MKTRFAVLSTSILGLFTSVTACNMVTGANDLTFDGSREVNKGGGQTGNNATGNGSGTGNGTGSGTGNGTGSGTGTGTGSGTDPGTQDKMAPAPGVTISEIALYQGVERVLMKGGQAVNSNVPVVQGRDALFRVFFSTDAKYNGSPVTARLYIGNAAPIEVTQTLSGTSAQEDLKSTLNFEVPAASMVPNATYRVAVVQPREQVSGTNPAAVFPASGDSPLNVDASPSVVRVQLVPLQYTADGSNRLPDTSQAQLQLYKDAFYGMYPASRIEITVHAPVTTNLAISADGTNWQQQVNAVATLRDNDKAQDNVFYYGIFQPGASFQTFCAQGCVAGLAYNILAPTDVYGRAAIGLGYTGKLFADTSAHEIGHVHGRYHAPCGNPGGPDPNYPYANGGIGVWGYDLVSKTLQSPATTSDVMGYCDKQWVSDYTFNALFQRIQLIDKTRVVFPANMMDRTYERVQIDATGHATFLSPVTLHKPPMSDPKTVTVQTATGTETLTGQLYTFDHLEGGLMLVPQSASPVRSMHFELSGQVISAVK